MIFFFFSQAYAEDIFNNMREERVSLINLLNQDESQSLNFDIHELENKIKETLNIQLGFCTKDISFLSDYLNEENLNDLEITGLKKSCLLELRKWEINIQKRVYKYHRNFLREILSREIKNISQKEDLKIKEITKKYSSFL